MLKVCRLTVVPEVCRLSVVPKVQWMWAILELLKECEFPVVPELCWLTSLPEPGYKIALSLRYAQFFTTGVIPPFLTMAGRTGGLANKAPGAQTAKNAAQKTQNVCVA